MSGPAEPIPSATVVAVRDAEGGLELLLLEKAGRPAPAPWVFPGGKLEAADRRGDPPTPVAAARAAAREAEEEAGLVLDPAALRPISRWITPEISARRFDTWFYLVAVPGDVEVQVDRSEIASHRWLRPSDALALHHRGGIRLAPPTFVTITWLEEHAAAEAALDALGARELLVFRPRIVPRDDGACILYPGDAGYEAGDPGRPGPRHRLWATPAYRYERRDES